MAELIDKINELRSTVGVDEDVQVLIKRFADGLVMMKEWEFAKLLKHIISTPLDSKVQDAVWNLCRKLTVNEKIQVVVKNFTIGAAVTGGCAFMGSLIGGPFGLSVGTVVGGGLASLIATDQLRYVPEILTEFALNLKERLCYGVMALLGKLASVKDKLEKLVLDDSELSKRITTFVVEFVTFAVKINGS